MSPRTSVITLTYNRPDYLAEAIESIEKQSDQDYEHLVLDNGSTDPRVLKVLHAAKTRRPNQFYYASSGGPMTDIVGRHWNTLFGFCRGEYITILDDDNRKRPDFIKEGSYFLSVHEVFSCAWQPINEDGVSFGEPVQKNLETSLENLFRDNTIDSNAIIFRKSVLEKIGMFDPHLTTNEDWHFIIRLIRHCKALHVPDVLLDYRVHRNARSKRALSLGAHQNWQRIRSELFTSEEIRDFRRTL